MAKNKVVTKMLVFEVVDVKSKKVLHSAEVRVGYSDKEAFQVKLGRTCFRTEEELLAKFIKTRWKMKAKK